MKNETGDEKIYRLIDLVKRLDRDKSTFLRWEAAGKIPRAKRDVRGWRYYTPDDFATVVRLAEIEGNLPSSIAPDALQSEHPAILDLRAIPSVAGDGSAVARDEATVEPLTPESVIGIGVQRSVPPVATMKDDGEYSDSNAVGAAQQSGAFGALAAGLASFGIAFLVTTAALDDSSMRREFVQGSSRDGLGSVVTERAAVAEPAAADVSRADLLPELREWSIAAQRHFRSAAYVAIEMLGRDILAITGETSDLARSLGSRATRSVVLIGDSAITAAGEFGQTFAVFAGNRITAPKLLHESVRRSAGIRRAASNDLATIPRGATEEIGELIAASSRELGEAGRSMGEYGAAAGAAAVDALGGWHRVVADVAEEMSAWPEVTTQTLLAAFGMRADIAPKSADAASNDALISIGSGVFPESTAMNFVTDDRIRTASRVLLLASAAHQDTFTVVRIEPGRGFWLAAAALPMTPIEFEYAIVTPSD